MHCDFFSLNMPEKLKIRNQTKELYSKYTLLKVYMKDNNKNHQKQESGPTFP